MAGVDCTNLAVGTALVVRTYGLRSVDRVVRITKVLKRGYRLDNGRFLSHDGGIGGGWDRYYVQRIATEDVIKELEIAESRRYVVSIINAWVTNGVGKEPDDVIAKVAAVIVGDGERGDGGGWMPCRDAMAPFMRSAGVEWDSEKSQSCGEG